MEMYEFEVRVQQLLIQLGKGRRTLATQIIVPKERGETADTVKWTVRQHASQDVYVSVAQASGRDAWIVNLEGAFDSLITCMYAVLTNHEKEMNTNRFG